MSPRASRPLILASASTGRLGVLRASGFDPQVIVSGVDETDPGGLTPAELARDLAVGKATAVATGDHRLPEGAVVIGGDSLLDVGGVALGKPADADEARQWWTGRAGTDAVLHSGLAVIDSKTGQCASDVASATIRFDEPTDEELDVLVASGEPTAVAGAFTVDGAAAPFVRSIEGHPTTVIGLSLPLLRTLLGELGIAFVDLWQPEAMR